MRKHPIEKMEMGRIRTGEWASDVGAQHGAFVLFGPCSTKLKIIASEGDPDIPWEHVSVSTPHRNPNWQEMCWVKDAFWNADEMVVQFHPPQSEYVNNHDYCLHLWKPWDGHIYLPPSNAVGIKKLGLLKEE